MREDLKRFGESLGERQSDRLIEKFGRSVGERLDWRSAQKLVRSWLFRFDVG